MGAEVELKVRNLSLLYWKSYFDKETLGLLFTDDDLQIIPDVKFDEQDVDEEPHTMYKYSTTVQKAIDRLNCEGYTINNIKAQFNNNKYRCIDYLPLLFKYIERDDYEEIKNTRINKYITFNRWFNSVWKYARFGLDNDLLLRWADDIDEQIIPKTECDKIVFSSLKGESSYFGCYYDEFDPMNTIRLILEKCPRDEEVFIDITEMVGWTYSSIEEMRLEDSTEKTIILVEGTNDKNILEFALKRIYPHLYNLYYFMDFKYNNDKKRNGGVDTISNNIKAFICSKIKAKFIAVFDNDTIGTQTMKKLIYEIGELPENVRVICYPNISRANKYPTLGTNGKVVLDNINGRACSTELYLPDFLLKINSAFPEIEWGSRIKAIIGERELHEYQGVVSSKSEIEGRFKTYKNEVERGEQSFDVHDWTEMKKLLDTIIYAFQNEK